MIVDIRKSQGFFFRKYRNRWLLILFLLVLLLFLFRELNLEADPALVGLGFVGPVYLLVQGLRFHHLYARWLKCNEAWGNILSRSRLFARQLLTLISVHQSKKVNVFDINSFQVELINRQIAVVYVMGYWLRHQFQRIGETVILLPPGEIEKLQKQENIPVAMIQRQMSRLQDAREMGMLDEPRYHRIEQTVSELNEAFEYCEKVKRTIYPAQMTFLGRLMSIFMGVLMVLFFCHTFTGWVVALMLGFAVYYLEDMNSDMEDPFGYDQNDVPITFISRMVETDLRHLLGETEKSRQVQSINGILF